MRREWQGAAACPGSCGELVQGTWKGINFLVPCPVDLYSVAKVKLRPGSYITGPADKPKAKLAVRQTLAFLGRLDLGGEVTIESQIPAGKGMASSTADIGAAITATATALGVTLRPQVLAQLAIGIEPTDGTLLPGVTLIDHVRGHWSLPLGTAPDVQILVVDPGGQVDTLQFNALPELLELNRLNEVNTQEAFYLVRRGIQEKRLDLLGQGATLSAETNQNILWKPLLPKLKNWGLQRGCLGVIAAHSGTVLGLIYPQNIDLLHEEHLLRRDFPELAQVWRVQLIPGGIKPFSVGEETAGPNINAHRPSGKGVG